MELVQVEGLVNELELRVDRLRALYDQYFMGIEKLEPTVPRKDVERRFEVLRKEQIRNTALRFKFQTILQRYNTYQTFWMRICRQIDEGTYKRHVMRANARFGEDATTKKKKGAAEPVAEVPESEKAVPAATSHTVLDGVGDDPFAFDDDDSKSGSIDVSFDLGDLGDPFGEDDPFPKPPPVRIPEPRNEGKVGAPAATQGAQTGAAKMRIAPMPPASTRAVVPQAKTAETREALAPDAHSRETERRLPVAPIAGGQASAGSSSVSGGGAPARPEPFFPPGKPAAGAPNAPNAPPNAQSLDARPPAAQGAMRVAPPRPPMPSSPSSGAIAGASMRPPLPSSAGGPPGAPVRAPLPSSAGAPPGAPVQAPLPSSAGGPPGAPIRAPLPSSAGAPAGAPVRPPTASSPGGAPPSAANVGPGGSGARPSMPSASVIGGGSAGGGGAIARPPAPSNAGVPAAQGARPGPAAPVRQALPSSPSTPSSPSSPSISGSTGSAPGSAGANASPRAPAPSSASLGSGAGAGAMRAPLPSSPKTQNLPEAGVKPAGVASPQSYAASLPPMRAQQMTVPGVAPPARPHPAEPAPVAARPAPAASPETSATTPKAAPAPARPSPPASAESSEERTRQLYSQYVETRRKQNEPTNAITYESLATTLKESTQRLKEKHGAHKAVDFEVVVKDGKTILRPIVK